MTRKDSVDESHIVTTKQISEILGLHARRIQQLTQEGALIRVAHGKYDLPRSVKTYIDYSIEKIMVVSDELDNNVETAKWTRARREKTELEVKIIKGALHRSIDVERVMNDMLGAFRARILSLPTKIAPQLVGIPDIPEIKEKLKDAVYEAMNELSDYDPLVFYDYSSDKMFIDEEEKLEMEVRPNGHGSKRG